MAGENKGIAKATIIFEGGRGHNVTDYRRNGCTCENVAHDDPTRNFDPRVTIRVSGNMKLQARVEPDGSHCWTFESK